MKRSILFALFPAVCITAPALAGPLTPPGAPAPTMKTLDEVEARTPIHAADIPLVINQPGSYYLTENIQHTGTSNGITVTESNVTIDLNGFTLDGSGATGSARGIIATSSNTTGTTIMNGTVSGWPNSGISLSSGDSFVKKVNARENGANGIAIASGSVLECSSEFNAETGIYFALTGNDNTVSGCKSSNNGDEGILFIERGLISDNRCSLNAGDGIHILGKGSIARNNNCSENSQHGILVSAPRCSIMTNNCYDNGLNGITVADPGSIISDNNCSANTGDGILINNLGANCLVKDNNCSRNKINGMSSSGANCRVENNNFVNNIATGLIINSLSASIALKNTSGNNGGLEYFFSPTVNRGPVIPLVGGDILSQHPWANFSY